MRVLITGADGFLGKNLRLHLSSRGDIEVSQFCRRHSVEQLSEMLHGVDFVFHLAGINRPNDPAEFLVGNTNLTRELCGALANLAMKTGRKVPVVYTSSTQAVRDNSYGQSKRAAEDALFALQRTHGVPVHVFRLPNVFGKWSKPNYNSVVATFCYNIARGLPIEINDDTAALTLVYVDHVIERFVSIIDGSDLDVDSSGFSSVHPQYTTTVGEVADLIKSFRDSRDTLVVGRVGSGFVRAMYSTYVSYLPPAEFAYAIPVHADQRGVFVEVLKTSDCGQISYFTAHPGVTRGGHYHHSKTEKFLVIKGRAQFKFRHVHTGEVYELVTCGEKPEVVETVPGWAHDITNVGDDEMTVLLWANELFDRQRPDTFAYQL